LVKKRHRVIPVFATMARHKKMCCGIGKLHSLKLLWWEGKLARYGAPRVDLLGTVQEK